MEFGHFPRNSVAWANPEGWERVAGGRSGQKGERPPEKRVGWSSTPVKGARPNQATIGRPCSQSRLAHSSLSKYLGSMRGTHVRGVPAQISGATPISSTRGSNESGTPPGCRSYPAPWPGGRRPKKPSATSGYRLANPSGCLIQNVQTIASSLGAEGWLATLRVGLGLASSRRRRRHPAQPFPGRGHQGMDAPGQLLPPNMGAYLISPFRAALANSPEGVSW
jgi:hypothetical protein